MTETQKPHFCIYFNKEWTRLILQNKVTWLGCWRSTNQIFKKTQY